MTGFCLCFHLEPVVAKAKEPPSASLNDTLVCHSNNGVHDNGYNTVIMEKKVGAPRKPSRPVGMKDLAEALGVSIGTIDRALHNKPGINPETEEGAENCSDSGLSPEHGRALSFIQAQPHHWRQHSAGNRLFL